MSGYNSKTQLQAELNTLGQAVGKGLDWHAARHPSSIPLEGQRVKLCAIEPDKHGPALYQQLGTAQHEHLWTYLPYGPFPSEQAYIRWLKEFTQTQNPLFFCICSISNQALGVFALSAIEARGGSLELAHVLLSPALQKNPMATEAVYLVLRYVFSLGYRRCEWKCNALNMASKKAALRYGFSYEGLFRQATVVKSRNRDTAWFGMTDNDWKAIEPAFQQWLNPNNFDHNNRQTLALSSLTRPLLRPLISNPLGTNTRPEAL